MIEDVRGREITVARGIDKHGEFQVKIYKASRLVLRLDRANATRFAGHLEGFNSVSLEDVSMTRVDILCAGRWAYVDKGRRSILNLRFGPSQDLAFRVWEVLGAVHSPHE